MHLQPIHWQTKDHLEIFAQAWNPEVAPRAILAIIHGLGEHSGRYAHFGEFYSRQGIAVFAADLRGHGQSGGARGATPAYDDLLDDLEVFFEQARQRYPGAPLFVFGQSMGGNLGLYYALKRKPKFNGMVISSPALRLAFAPQPLRIGLGRLLNRLAPQVALPNGLAVTALSRDPQVGRDYQQDPLVHDRLTSRLGLGFLDAGEWILAHAGELRTPTLLMHGAADQITSAEASAEFARRAGAVVTLSLWEGFYHELHNEPEQGQVFATALDWIEARLS